MGRCNDKRHPHFSSFLQQTPLPHYISTIRPSTLCLLLVLLSLSNQQRRRNPPLPPFPQFPTIPQSTTTPPTNHSLRSWLSDRFQSRKTRLAASTTRASWRIPTLHLRASFTMSLTADTSTPSTSQTQNTVNGTTNPAQSSPGTYSIVPTILMSLELRGGVTPSTASRSILVDTPRSTPP